MDPRPLKKRGNLYQCSFEKTLFLFVQGKSLQGVAANFFLESIQSLSNNHERL